MDKILFLMPDYYGNPVAGGLFRRKWPPLAYAVAAAILEQKGCKVKIIDNNVSRFSAIKTGAIAENYDAVVVATAPYDRWQCPQSDLSPFFDAIAEIPPEKLLITGPHATEMPLTILNMTGAAAVIQGEPEAALSELAETAHLQSISGAVFFKQGKPVKNNVIPRLIHFEDIPDPAFHLLDMEAYSYELMGKNFTLLEGSRGCPVRCSFCYLGMFGKKVRFKSPKKLFAEAENAVKNYGIKNIYFMDLEFGLNKLFVRDFCRLLIKNDLKVNWCCQMRVTDANGDLFKLMKAAGCSLIHFGAESGSDRILEASGKKITTEDARKASETALRAGIRRAFFFTFGFPGETQWEMNKTISHAISLNPEYASFHILNPYPGTSLARKYGIKPVLKPYYSYPGYLSDEHEFKTLNTMVKKAYLGFYLRPSSLFRILRTEAHNLTGKLAVFSDLVTGYGNEKQNRD